MLQLTNFINKIRMLQWTKMLQRTRKNTIGRRSTRVRMTCRAFPFWLERQSSYLLSFVRISYQFSSVICLFSPLAVKICIFFKLFRYMISTTSRQNKARKLTFWRRNYFFLILAHPVYKIWIIQEPNTLELWNKLHFEEKITESIYHV